MERKFPLFSFWSLFSVWRKGVGLKCEKGRWLGKKIKRLFFIVYCNSKKEERERERDRKRRRICSHQRGKAHMFPGKVDIAPPVRKYNEIAICRLKMYIGFLFSLVVIRINNSFRYKLPQFTVLESVNLLNGKRYRNILIKLLLFNHNNMKYHEESS